MCCGERLCQCLHIAAGDSVMLMKEADLLFFLIALKGFDFFLMLLVVFPKFPDPRTRNRSRESRERRNSDGCCQHAGVSTLWYEDFVGRLFHCPAPAPRRQL